MRSSHSNPSADGEQERPANTLHLKRRTGVPFAPPHGGSDHGPAPLRSDALLQGRSHVAIAHNGELYQLRATRLGKLILTK